MNQLPPTEQQFAKILSDFSGLVFAAARKVKGDYQGSNSLNDALQNMRLALWEGILGYLKKTDQDWNDDLLTDDDFQRYVSACIWTKKSRVGEEITKKFIVRNTPSLTVIGKDDCGTWHDESANAGPRSSMALSPEENLFANVKFLSSDLPLNGLERDMFVLICESPSEYLFKSSNGFNKKKIFKEMGIGHRLGNDTLDSLLAKVKDYMDS